MDEDRFRFAPIGVIGGSGGNVCALVNDKRLSESRPYDVNGMTLLKTEAVKHALCVQRIEPKWMWWQNDHQVCINVDPYI